MCRCCNHASYYDRVVPSSVGHFGCVAAPSFCSGGPTPEGLIDSLAFGSPRTDAAFVGFVPSLVTAPSQNNTSRPSIWHGHRGVSTFHRGVVYTRAAGSNHRPTHIRLCLVVFASEEGSSSVVDRDSSTRAFLKTPNTTHRQAYGYRYGGLNFSARRPVSLLDHGGASPRSVPQDVLGEGEGRTGTGSRVFVVVCLFVSHNKVKIAKSKSKCRMQCMPNCIRG